MKSKLILIIFSRITFALKKGLEDARLNQVNYAFSVPLIQIVAIWPLLFSTESVRQTVAHYAAPSYDRIRLQISSLGLFKQNLIFCF